MFYFSPQKKDQTVPEQYYIWCTLYLNILAGTLIEKTRKNMESKQKHTANKF